MLKIIQIFTKLVAKHCIMVQKRKKVNWIFLLLSLLLNIGLVWGMIAYYKHQSKNFDRAYFGPQSYQRKVLLFEMYPNHNQEVIFLGNSITEEGYWGEFFDNVQVINRGISGDKTQGIRNRIGELIESRPQKIFIMMGINDLFAGIPQIEIMKNYKAVLEQIVLKSPETQIYLQSVLPVGLDLGNSLDINEKVKDLNSQIEALAATYEAEYIDLHRAFLKEGYLNKSYSNDDLHLNGAGYQLWKKKIQKLIDGSPPERPFVLPDLPQEREQDSIPLPDSLELKPEPKGRFRSI